MAHRKSSHTSVTLFYLALLFAFALLADASSPQQVNHKRLLRKRAPQGLAGVNPALTPSSRSSLGASSTTKTDSPSPAVSTPTPPIISPLPSSPALSTSSSDPLSTSSSSPSSSSLSSSTPSTSTSVSSTSASSPSPLTSSTPAAKSTFTSLAPDTPSTFTQTATLTKGSATPSPQAQGAANSGPSTKKTTTMVIIIIAASVGGITILWTLFRKWKLGRSSRFDERLQPIDWQPPAGGEGRHGRSSIDRSGAQGAHGSEQGHASSDDHNHISIPDHDFTPLPSNRLAPVGTYTDLTRGPSPQPEMQEAYAHHSPVMTRPAYDVHLPLHHQAGYGGHGHDVYNHTQFNSGPVGY